MVKLKVNEYINSLRNGRDLGFPIRLDLDKLELQEAGVGVGWPLGLGQDTTGWPLGLRLRLMQEDLQWPREPNLTCSSATSDDSSSFDTMSTRSFFQDKSVSLGTLIGIPMRAPSNPLPAQLQQHRHRLHDVNNVQPLPSTVGANTPTSPTSTLERPSRNTVRNPNRYSTTNVQGSRSRFKETSLPSNSGSNSITGWNLLSVINCARVPAQLGALNKADDAAASPRPRSPLAGGVDSQKAGLNEHGVRRDHETIIVSSTDLKLSSPRSKLYDNITFQEEEYSTLSDEKGSHSSTEWNPLFASTTLEALDDEEFSDNSDAAESLNDVQAALRRGIPRCQESLDEAHSSRTTGSSSTGSDLAGVLSNLKEEMQVDKVFQRKLTRLSRANRKQKTVSILVSRIVCCRSTSSRPGASFEQANG